MTDHIAVPFIHTVDAALLHVAAILDPDVKNTRLHAWDEVINWNMILAEMRRLYPDRKLADDLPDAPMLELTSGDQDVTEGLLKKWGNQPGYKSLEETIKDIVAGLKDQVVE